MIVYQLHYIIERYCITLRYSYHKILPVGRILALFVDVIELALEDVIKSCYFSIFLDLYSRVIYGEKANQVIQN